MVYAVSRTISRRSASFCHSCNLAIAAASSWAEPPPVRRSSPRRISSSSFRRLASIINGLAVTWVATNSCSEASERRRLAPLLSGGGWDLLLGPDSYRCDARLLAGVSRTAMKEASTSPARFERDIDRLVGGAGGLRGH